MEKKKGKLNEEEEEEEKRRRKKLMTWMKPMCKCTWIFSSIKQPNFYLQFSPHFGERIFW